MEPTREEFHAMSDNQLAAWHQDKQQIATLESQVKMLEAQVQEVKTSLSDAVADFHRLEEGYSRTCSRSVETEEQHRAEVARLKAQLRALCVVARKIHSRFQAERHEPMNVAWVQNSLHEFRELGEVLSLAEAAAK